MKTYLSIDIDFWNDEDPWVLWRDLNKIILRAYESRPFIPVHAVMNHQQLTPLVSKSGAKKLVNIDMHSDLADTNVRYFECGTWVSYVDWRKKGEYLWIYRHDLDDGECNGDNPIFHCDNRARQKISDWKKVACKRVQQLPPMKQILDGVIQIGISLSPSWRDRDFEDVFQTLIHYWRIPYTKGRRNEHDFRVAKRPR